MSSVQRAFAHKLSKQHAADVRRQIATSTSYSRELSKSGSNFSGFSSTMSLCEIVEPLDYEEFLAQHQTLLERDPLKLILDFPPNDVELKVIKRKICTEEPVVPSEPIELVSPYVKRCIDSFTSDWVIVHRKFKGRASPIARDQLVQETPRQDFEVDQEEVNGSSSPNEDESDLSQCGSQDTSRGSWASLDLRHSQHDPLLPSLLDRVCPETIDQVNEQKRLEDRQEALFPLYALPTSSDDEWQEITLATEPLEPFSHKILIKCLQLKLELEVEPIFASLALYDAKEKKKVSENFYVDMNTESLKRMLGSHVAYSDGSTLARNCILSISKPSTDLFLVVRLEKVLQGDISECAEPYLRDDKNKDKVRAAAVAACDRLGRYRMPLAWTAIHLSGVIGGGGDTDSTGSAGSLDRKSVSLEQWRKKVDPPTRRGSLERRSSDKRRSWSPDDFANCLDSFRPITLTVSSFFKQENERLRDEDLYKLLVELKRPGSNLKRLKCLPGILKLDISPRPEELPRCLDPDLRRLSPYPDEKSRPIKEILEFPSEIISPDLTYRNLLYVYPKEVNFSSRTGSARNIAVRVQLMGGEQESEAMTAIFGKSSCPEMTHESFTSVTYHNKNPNFYDEIKIRMPADLSARHHLLFTFYHISCQKKVEQPNVETPVAYTWLPLLRDGHLQSGEFSLPAMLDPPPANYSYIAPDVLLPGTRWVDAHRGVFTLVLEPVSSVHPQDKYIDRFLSLCGALELGQVPPRIGEAGMESELKAALLELARTSQVTLIRSLPQIFDQLVSLLVRPPTLPSQPLNVAATVFEAIGLLVRNITNMQDSQVDSHGRHPLLTTYTAYQCSLPRMTQGSGVARAQSNPDLPIEDLEMEIHSRGLDRTASMRHDPMHTNNHCIPSTHRILHEELALHWVVSTGQARELAITHSWFFLELIVRSMVVTIAEFNLLESARKNRFSPQFCDDLSTLVAALTSEIINRCGKDNRVASNLTSSLGNFLSDLFSVMDRGLVLSLLRTSCCSLADASMQVPDSVGLFGLKIDLVRTVCSHEHYVALNLPFGTGYTSGSAPTSPSPSTGSSGSLISTLVPAERARFAELSPEFRQQHFLVGLVLLDLSNTLEIPNPILQNKAIGTVRYLMSCHDADPRYAEPAAKARVAALYLPLLNILMDALPQLYHWDSKERSVFTDETGSITQSVALAIAGGAAAEVAGSQCRVSLSSEATRHLLMCVLWLMKSLEKSAVAQWISELSSRRILCILQLLNIATAAFEYKGKKALKRLPSQATATSDIRSRLEDVILGQGSARSEMMMRRKERASGDRLRWRKDQMSYRLTEQPEGRVVEQDAHIEGALAAEASLVVLDTLETIVQADGGGGVVVGGVLKVLLRALARNQSTLVLQHMFNTQRALVFKYHSALFDEEESERCGDLCLTLLTRCSSPLSAVRSHAAASLYLLMRQNFEIGNNFARVKMQVTTSLSALVGRGRAPNEGALRRSLKTVLVYAEKDTELADTSFPEQVKDLLFNLHMILSDTVKMKEFQEDPEMLLDLMYRIAKGYQGSPDLRLTWLANMAQQHMERKNHTEAAMCLVHSAALVAEYLHLLEPGGGGRPIGAVALSPISPNAFEESAVGDDVLARREEGLCLGPDFSESGLAGLLEHAASSFHAAGMYEVIPDVYRVLLPIAEAAHDYKKLANIHGKLHEAYTRIEQLAGKRVFGTYFRVGFYGTRFGDLNGEEFIYKEPTLTKLPEIFSRLENFYAERFGSENVVIIKDSNPVDASKLEVDKAFVQITYVEPYFEAYELRHRSTVFHKNFNIKRFMYATPFTPGGKAHGELREQCKRKTILTVATHFPYLKTRIRVVARKQIVLSPIEVAIEDIQKKTTELAAATVQEPSDAKMLQMVLQGCIGTTVNQGPAEVANVFLSGLRDQSNQPSKLQHKLRLCFKDFSKKCLDALRKNKNLIGPDQRDYQRELERNYQRFTERLAPLIAWSGHLQLVN
ncbi:PREDICTED: dedicator of cytokinesis protein 7 [Ceratosolen solmsi marchali]|uniref:Dedicator of cytokinesis protein 7 n=1 Tax=Ceratosolen solmsi marchali TaxID=326594 RepID=A0AAJ6YPR8_9HYME|nr:PREDICTED: dedicator of cytokinesis protein 7 [Ceratosolen solmsi marchali]